MPTPTSYAQGEVTVVVEGASQGACPPADADLRGQVQELMQRGESPSQAAKLVAAQCNVPRGQVYAVALELANKDS